MNENEILYYEKKILKYQKKIYNNLLNKNSTNDNSIYFYKINKYNTILEGSGIASALGKAAVKLGKAAGKLGKKAAEKIKTSSKELLKKAKTSSKELLNKAKTSSKELLNKVKTSTKELLNKAKTKINSSEQYVNEFHLDNNDIIIHHDNFKIKPINITSIKTPINIKSISKPKMSKK
jgi:polyhydroxyalkanoate synthesis regulator phasin